MANEPGLTEIVTTTLRNRRGVLVDNITNNNPVLRAMKDYDSIEEEDGGRTLVEEHFFQETGNVMHYHAGQPLDLTLRPVSTAFEVDWKQFGGSVVIHGREKRMNAGMLGKIKLLKSRLKGLEYSMENFYNADLISDGTADGGLQIGGIKYWISSTPSSGTIGGIDRSSSSNTYARNTKFDTVNDTTGGAPGGVATSASTIRPYWDFMLNSVTRSEDTTKIILAGQSHYQFAQTALQPIQRTEDSNTVRAGYKRMWYQGVPVVMCGGVVFGGQTQIAVDRSYGLNTMFFKIRVHQDANMDPLPQVQSINQDSEAQIVIFMGNATCSAPKLQWVMFDS